MKYILLTLFILSSCIATISKKEQKSFEGIINYSVETKIKKQDKYSNYLSQKYGNEMDFFWGKNGDQLRKTYGNNEGLEFALYKQQENLSYTKFRTYDTLYYYSSSEILDKIVEIKDGPNEDILNQKCKSIIFVIEIYNSKETFEMHYYYSGEPYINNQLYSNLKDGFANVIYSKTNSPFLKMELRFNNYSITYKANKITRKKIENEIFTIPNTLVKKRV